MSAVKWLARVVLRAMYRVEVEGAEHVRAAMPRAVIAANHASFLDGLLLGAFLPGERKPGHQDVEGDAGLVDRHQAPVGDRDTMGITREVGEHRLGSAERLLGIDHPLRAPERGEEG